MSTAEADEYFMVPVPTLVDLSLDKVHKGIGSSEVLKPADAGVHVVTTTGKWYKVGEDISDIYIRRSVLDHGRVAVSFMFPEQGQKADRVVSNNRHVYSHERTLGSTLQYFEAVRNGDDEQEIRMAAETRLGTSNPAIKFIQHDIKYCEDLNRLMDEFGYTSPRDVVLSIMSMSVRHSLRGGAVVVSETSRIKDLYKGEAWNGLEDVHTGDFSACVTQSLTDRMVAIDLDI